MFAPEQLRLNPDSQNTRSQPLSLCKCTRSQWRADCNQLGVEQPLISTEFKNLAQDPFKVLVADDQAAITHALELLLRSAEMEVLIANSPNEVVAEIGRSRFDLLLMDMNYGRDTTSGQEGLDLIDLVRKQDPQLQIVVMTAWSTIDLAVATLQRGAADFIQKPWDNDAALKVVQRQAFLTRDQRTAASQRARDNEDALEVQRSLLGAAQKSYGRFSVAGATRSANVVGGDYFDSFCLPNDHFVFCIADCMGKGTGAALAMANLQAQLRFEATRAATPADVCENLNRRAFDSRLQRLTTMFYGDVDTRRGTLNYTNAGHSPAFLIRANGTVERLHTDDALLGGIPSWRYRQLSVELGTGDRLVAVTDGLLEGTDANGEEIGEEGVIRRALAARDRTATEMLETILEAASSSPVGLNDDTTALVIAVD